MEALTPLLIVSNEQWLESSMRLEIQDSYKTLVDGTHTRH